MSLAMKVAAGGRTVAPGGVVAGDPGLFGFLGKAVRAAGSVAGSLLTGGPFAAVRTGIGQVSGMLSAKDTRQATALARRRSSNRGTDFNAELQNALANRSATRFGPSGQVTHQTEESWRGQLQLDSGCQTGSGVACPTGYHPNKAGYWRRNNRNDPGQGATWVPAKSVCVKNRRNYNPANARATSRSITRIKSAKRMAKSLGKITVRE